MPSSLNLQSVSTHTDFVSAWDISNPMWEDELIISSTTYLSSTTDGPAVVKYIKGLTINQGCTLTVSNRCRGLYLFIYGDVLINGALTMTYRGCIAPADNLGLDYINAQILVNPTNISSFQYSIKSSTGGAGAPAWKGTVKGGQSGSNGYAGTLGSSGGGGSGATDFYGYAGGGAKGTCYSGGGGGGGGTNHTQAHGGTAISNGGRGGAGGYFASGGAGNPGGAAGGGGVAGGSVAGGSGTGGSIIMIVKGNITISSTGTIKCNGNNGGGKGSQSVSAGGSSGGGNINILYSETYSNSGTIQANGGGRINGGLSIGGGGGYGSIRVAKVTV